MAFLTRGEAVCPLDQYFRGKLVPGCQRHRGHFQLKLAAKLVLSLEDHYEDQEGTCGSCNIIP